MKFPIKALDGRLRTATLHKVSSNGVRIAVNAVNFMGVAVRFHRANFLEI